MRRAPWILAATALLAVTGCGDDDGDGSEPAPATDTGPDEEQAGGEQAGGERYDDVGELAAALDGVADGCTLEYEGLRDDQRELSICTLGGEIAELSVWSDIDALAALVDAATESGDPVVAGANWSVDVVDPELAAEVADAAGGTVHP